MDNTITYLNTDLDLVSDQNLGGLSQALEAMGVRPLCPLVLGDDGLSYVVFETEDHFREPQANIVAMLTAIESLDDALRRVWDRCSRREFNVGYDCGAEPWAFNQGLSADVLGRMAALGASFRITLYPDRSEDEAAMASDHFGLG